jgi:glycosyltransferase involved in cell wall biosynthesis
VTLRKPSRSTRKSSRSANSSLLYIVTPPLAAGWFLRGQLRYMRDAGLDVTVITAPGPSLLETCHAEGATPIPIPMNREIAPLQDLVALWRLCRVMRRMRPVITNVGTPKAGLLGGLAAWLMRVPCRIYTLRTLRYETTSGVKRQVLLLCERLACACAHQIICVSESVRQQAVSMGIVQGERAMVLGSGSSHGVDTQRFAPSVDLLRRAAVLRQRLGFAPEDPVIGFVGRITRDKGIPELLEAFELLRPQFPGLRLLLVGDYEQGDPIPRASRQKIESDPYIVRSGFVTDTEVYYQAMNVLALPSRREGFPNVALEAHAACKPVVATRVTGVVDAVGKDGGGALVTVGDSTALADGLARLLKDSFLAKVMGEAGRARVVREFEQESVWQALLQQYHKLLEEKGLAAVGNLD